MKDWTLTIDMKPVAKIESKKVKLPRKLKKKFKKQPYSIKIERVNLFENQNVHEFLASHVRMRESTNEH